MPSIARGVIQHRRRRTTVKGPIITDIGPDMPLDRLALGQDRHGRVVAMQPLGSQHVALDQRMQRLQDARAGANLVGQRRHAQIDAFAPVALALAVQWLMLAEFLEQDHGQQVRPGKSPRRDMERRRRLRDRLAFPARELLAHRLDDLPLARDHLQRLGDILPELRQLRRPAARTTLWRGNDYTLARQMIGEWLARRPLALERLYRLRPGYRFLGRQLVLGRRRFQIFQLKFHLLQQPRFALRVTAVKSTPKLLDLELEMGDQRFRAGVHRQRAGRNRLRCHARGVLGQAGGSLREDHRMSGGKIGWQRFRRRCHTLRESYSSATAKKKPSAHRRWAPCLLRIAPIDSGQQIAKLSRGDSHRAVGPARP